jgi:serine/threonine-protein kinase
VISVGDLVADRYRIDRVIGQGGMGVVAAATHVQLGERVAIKVIRQEMARDDAFVARLMREARASATVGTDHVCRVFDVGRLPSGEPYLVMELLEGSDLARVIAQAPLSIATAADYVLQACVALSRAHAAGIVHRDLKPGNLFLTKQLDGQPRIKLLDFGIAKAPGDDLSLTHTAATLGSPRYMSPEQLRSARDVDPRTDIWSLGVILYELVSQRVPFPAESITELAVKVTVDPPQPLDVEPGFHAVIWKCLEKPVERRYQDVAALAADLVRFASPVGAAAAKMIGAARPRAEPSRAVVDSNAATVAGSGALAVSAPQRKSRAWLGVVGAVAIAGGAGAIALWPKHEAARVAADAPRPMPIDARAIDAPSPDAAIVIDAAPAAADIAAQLRAAYQAKQWDKVMAYGHQLSRKGRLTKDIDQLYAQASQAIIEEAQPAIMEKLEYRDCAAARALEKTAFARADKWDNEIDKRIRECEDAHPTTDHDIAQAIEDLEYVKAINLGEGVLAHDPKNQGVLEQTGMAACYAKDAPRAQKYLNALTNSETREARLDLCRGMGNDVH